MNLLFGLPVLHSSSRISPKLLNLHSTVKLNITNFVDIISQPNNLMFILLVCSISKELRPIFKVQLVMDSAEVNLCFTGFCSAETGCTVKISFRAVIPMGPSQPGSIPLSLLHQQPSSTPSPGTQAERQEDKPVSEAPWWAAEMEGSMPLTLCYCSCCALSLL